jgi:hypothetical protein
MNEEIALEWREYLLTSPSFPEWSGWISIKAAEHGLDPFDLAGWLVLNVERPPWPPLEAPPKPLPVV